MVLHGSPPELNWTKRWLHGDHTIIRPVATAQNRTLILVDARRLSLIFCRSMGILSINRGETEFFGSFLRKSPGQEKLSFCWPQNIEKIHQWDEKPLFIGNLRGKPTTVSLRYASHSVQAIRRQFLNGQRRSRRRLLNRRYSWRETNAG